MDSAGAAREMRDSIKGSQGGDPDMERRRAYSPSALDRLEDRVVLSHQPTRGLSVVVSGLFPHQQVINRHQQPVVAEVNQAFASFASDYGQARATYFASILNQSNPSMATTNAFVVYTKQRVSVLAQQVISSFLQAPEGTARAHGQPEALKQLISMKICGPQGQEPVGSLVHSLINTIPPAGISAPSASLYSSSQDNAIESARVAVINGINIVKNGDFGNQTNSHSNHK
jgi:hypothetical protein